MQPPPNGAELFNIEKDFCFGGANSVLQRDEGARFPSPNTKEKVFV